MGVRDLFKCQYWGIVFYNLIVQFAMAIFTCVFASVLLGLGYGFVISIFLLPAGIVLLWVYGIMIRVVVLIDLEIMNAFLGAKVPKYPEVFSLGDRSVESLQRNGCIHWIFAILKDTYMIRASLYYMFVRLPFAIIAFVFTVILVVSGIAGITYIFLLAFCDVCHENNEYSSKEQEWLFSTYGGAALLVVIGVILLIISTKFLGKLASTMCRLQCFFLSPEELDYRNINFKLLEDTQDNNNSYGTNNNNNNADRIV